MSKHLGLVGMGVEHGIVCIDCFCVLICSTGDVLWLCEYMHDRMCIELKNTRVRKRNLRSSENE